MMAQELKVKSFSMDMMDLSAQKYAMKDENDDDCALVKVGFAEPSVSFEGYVVGQPQQKTGEYWVYMVDGAENIKIMINKYAPLSFDFPQPLQKRCTYVLTLELPQEMTMDKAKEMVGGAAKMEFGKPEEVTIGTKGNIFVSFYAQYPKGDSNVDVLIREWINETYGDSYSGDINNGKALVEHYAASKYKELKEGYDASSEIDVFDEVKVIYETDKLITLQHSCSEDFHEGDDLPYESSCATFRKSDGRKFNKEIFKNPEDEGLKRLLADGIKEYFRKEYQMNSYSDTNLFTDLNIFSVSEIRLPNNGEYYVTSSHFIINYPKYDFTNNSFQVIIPLGKIKPYLISSFANCLNQ